MEYALASVQGEELLLHGEHQVMAPIRGNGRESHPSDEGRADHGGHDEHKSRSDHECREFQNHGELGNHEFLDCD